MSLAPVVLRAGLNDQSLHIKKDDVKRRKPKTVTPFPQRHIIEHDNPVANLEHARVYNSVICYNVISEKHP